MTRQIIYLFKCSFLDFTRMLKLTGEYCGREFSQTCLNSLSQHFTHKPKMASDYPCPSVPAKIEKQTGTRIVIPRFDNKTRKLSQDDGTDISRLVLTFLGIYSTHNIKNLLVIFHNLKVWINFEVAFSNFYKKTKTFQISQTRCSDGMWEGKLELNS